MLVGDRAEVVRIRQRLIEVPGPGRPASADTGDGHRLLERFALGTVRLDQMPRVSKRLSVATDLTEKIQVPVQREGLGSAVPGTPRALDRTQERCLVTLHEPLETLDPSEPGLVSGLGGNPPGFDQMPGTLREPLPRTGPAGKADQLEHDVDIGRAPRVGDGEAGKELQRLPVEGDGLRPRVERTGARARAAAPSVWCSARSHSSASRQ